MLLPIVVWGTQMGLTEEGSLIGYPNKNRYPKGHAYMRRDEK